MTAGPELAACPAVLFIAYTPGADAEARGYTPWLRRVDNPFFNAIPGVRHYANWRIERVLSGDAPPYDYFDFQGLAAEDDLHRVWFNPDLDGFRKEWIRLWGYGASAPPPVQRNSYLMQRRHVAATPPQDVARLTGGLGAPPPAADLVWLVTATVRKHFAVPTGGAWMVPAAEDNPLGLDWLALTYGAAAASGPAPPRTRLDVLARCLAAPDQVAAP